MDPKMVIAMVIFLAIVAHRPWPGSRTKSLPRSAFEALEYIIIESVEIIILLPTLAWV